MPQSSAFNKTDVSVPSAIKPSVLSEMEDVELFASITDNGQLNMPLPHDHPKPTESKFQEGENVTSPRNLHGKTP